MLDASFDGQRSSDDPMQVAPDSRMLWGNQTKTLSVVVKEDYTHRMI
jgi:hypothetical protein